VAALDARQSAGIKRDKMVRQLKTLLDRNTWAIANYSEEAGAK
jgi:hypothetical protein